MDIWAFVRKICVIYVVALHLLSFSVGLILAIHISLLAIRSQIFEYLRETFCRRALGYLDEPDASRMKIYLFALRKCLTIIDLCKGLWPVGARFHR